MEIKNLYDVSGFTFDNKKQAEYFISLVESKDFDEDQLKEIHEGVKNNLVVDYADPSYDSYKMEVIKNALIYNVKIDYGFEVPSFTFREKAINGFKKNVNVVPFLLKYPKLSTSKIDIIIYGLTLNVPNIKDYINQGFNYDQLFEIFYSIEKGVDTSLYAKPQFDYQQMEQIRYGLEKELDVTVYADPEFTWEQMEQIRWGLINKVRVSIYANPKINHYEMNEIRLGLKNNLDISIYNKIEFNWEQMREIRKGLESNVNISLYAKPNFTSTQMFEIRTGLEKNLDVSIYARTEFNHEQMKEIREGLESELDVSIYAKKEYKNKEMNEIRLSLLSGDFKPKTLTKIKMFIQKIKGN